VAYEESADGHHENGNMMGVEYLYHLDHRWGIGAAIEAEVFGDNNERNGVLVMPEGALRVWIAVPEGWGVY
jgi:hypothetical protein